MSRGCALHLLPRRRAQCAQILSKLSEGPAQGLSRERERTVACGLWEGEGVGFASQEVRGHRASHSLGGFDLGRPKYPSRRGLSLPNSAWRCSATSEPRVPFPRPPHPAGTRTAGGRHALTCTADPPRGPEPGFEVRRIPTRLGEVDARPHTAARPLPPQGVGRRVGGRRALLERKRNKSGVK